MNTVYVSCQLKKIMFLSENKINSPEKKFSATGRSDFKFSRLKSQS